MRVGLAIAVVIALGVVSTARAQSTAEPAPGEPAPEPSGGHTLFGGASLLYGLGAWPGAVLFGTNAVREAPGVAVAVGGRFRLLPEIELLVDVGARFFFFGDIAADTMPGALQAADVRILEPTFGTLLRIRPGAGRFHIEAGAGVGYAFLQGAVTSGTPLAADRSGVTGELRGGVGVLFGPTLGWDVSVRLRLVGYPRVEGIDTMATLLEIELTGPILQ